MEGSICVETVKKVNSSDAMVRVSVLVGDDDSSAISQVRREVDPSIQKWSDVNHAKKGLGNRLFELEEKPQGAVRNRHQVCAEKLCVRIESEPR